MQQPLAESKGVVARRGLKEAVGKPVTRRTRTGKLEEVIEEVNRYTQGWIVYYRLTDALSVYVDLDSWLRRRMRQQVWKRWKRGKTRYRELGKMGVPAERAALGAIGTSTWRMAAMPVGHEARSNAYLRNSGLRSKLERYRELRNA